MTWLDKVAFGFDHITGASSNVKFGRNPDIDTATDPEDVWDGGGVYTGQPTGSAETVEVFSSSTDDDGEGTPGTGARTVRLYGLDANYVEQEVDVTLNGTSAVATTETWLRVYRLKVLTAGSGGQNAGTLTVRHTSTTANVFTVVPVAANQSSVCAFTVPANVTCLIKHIYISLTEAVGAADYGVVSLRIRDDGGVFRTAWSKNMVSTFPVDLTFVSGILVSEKADVKVTVESVGANDTSVSAALDYVLLQTG